MTPSSPVIWSQSDITLFARVLYVNSVQEELSRVEPRLLNYSDNPVRWDPSTYDDSFTAYGAQAPRAVRFGMGLAYFNYTYANSEWPAWRGAFGLFGGSPIEYSPKDHGIVSVKINRRDLFPCSGLITSTGEGYLCAPAVRLYRPDSDIVLMMLTSRRITPLMVSSEKLSLTVAADEAELSLSFGGELQCLGSIGRFGFRTAKVLLGRKPRLPVFTRKYEQTLLETKYPGTMVAKWRPVTGTFDDCALAFNPAKMRTRDRFSIDEVSEMLGAPEEIPRVNDLVVGDGGPVDYTLRLVVDHHLGMHRSDEAKLVLS